MGDKADRAHRAIVCEHLRRTCGIDLTELKPRPGQKSVDFELTIGGSRVLVAELKTFVEREPTMETGWTVRRDEDGFEEAFRICNAPARILRAVDEAYRQLAVYPHPWAILMLNTDYAVDREDCLEAFRGERYLGMIDGHRVFNVAWRKAALGKTLKTRYEVDLYIWISTRKPEEFSVWWGTPAGESVARRYFSAADRPTSAGT